MENEKTLVSFLGPEGSYTHQATLNRFPSSSYTLLPQRTIPDIFHAVGGDGSNSGSASPLGVVPFENSTNGSVVATLDLLANPTVAARVRIVAEVYLPVQHSLSAAAGLGSAAAITKLYSHPQAWGQCAAFLGAERWKAVEKQDVSSTSRAAELVAGEGAGSTSGAIASAAAARLNGLTVLEEGIEDVKGNCTRFFVLESRGEREEEEEEGEGEKKEGEAGDASANEALDDEGFKTLLTLTVSHAEPGALADCLAVFKRVGLNLTSINTRPSGESPWHYVFFVEFIGRKGKGSEGGKVNDALKELDRVARSWRWMGSWKNQLLNP